MDDLTSLQRDFLFVINGLDEPIADDLNEELESYYCDTFEYSRIRANIGVLEDKGLVRDPTDSYDTSVWHITERGKQKLALHREWAKNKRNGEPHHPSDVEDVDSDSRSETGSEPTGIDITIDLSSLPSEVSNYALDELENPALWVDRARKQVDQSARVNTREYGSKTVTFHRTLFTDALRLAIESKIDTIERAVESGERDDFTLRDVQRMRATVEDIFGTNDC